MKPVDMKLSKKDGDRLNEPTVSGAPEGPRYPWGLTLRLENESLEKLGIKEMPDAGTECEVMAMAKVVSVEKREVAGGKSRRHMELQITKLAIGHSDDQKSFERGFKKGPKKGY